MRVSSPETLTETKRVTGIGIYSQTNQVFSGVLQNVDIPVGETHIARDRKGTVLQNRPGTQLHLSDQGQCASIEPQQRKVRLDQTTANKQ